MIANHSRDDGPSSLSPPAQIPHSLSSLSRTLITHHCAVQLLLSLALSPSSSVRALSNRLLSTLPSLHPLLFIPLFSHTTLRPSSFWPLTRGCRSRGTARATSRTPQRPCPCGPHSRQSGPCRSCQPGSTSSTHSRRLRPRPTRPGASRASRSARCPSPWSRRGASTSDSSRCGPAASGSQAPGGCPDTWS